MMKRLGMLLGLLIAVLAAPAVSAQPLPCADAYAASATELISSIRVADMPDGTATVTELFVRISIFSVNRGNSSPALTLLQFVENMIDRDLLRGRIDPVTAESLKTLIGQTRAVLANCTATPPILTLNCRSGDGENDLLWLTPPGTHSSTTILYRTDTYPQGPTDPFANLVGTYPGGPDEVGRATHDTLANGMRYYYAAYAEDSSGDLAPGKLTFGRPQSRTGAFRWSYTAGGTGRPSIGGFGTHFMTTSSTGFVFALDSSGAGGTWAPGLTPASVPSPGGGRPISLPGNLTPNGDPWVLVSSTEGRIWAINETTGATEWTSPDLGDPVEASVCAMFSSYGGVDDVVMVGTVDRFGGSRFVGLDFADGTVAWSFDNGGGSNRIGPIRESCTVDYDRQQVYFTSEPGRRGSQDTVWALALDDGSSSLLWSALHPRVNTGVVIVGDALYVGTNFGEVISVDVADGSSRWTSPYSTGDGPVQGFIFPGRAGRLAFSTANSVHLVEDQGTGAVALWQPSISLANPTVPLMLGDIVLVADAEGHVYSLDATVAQPTVTPFADFGDSTRRLPLGLPFYNRDTKLYGVGTAEGVLYVVEAP